MIRSNAALLMSFSAWLLQRYRLDVSVQASEFLEVQSPAVSLADYVGLPVELMGKLLRTGNPADYLTIRDVEDLAAFIEGQRDVINAQQRLIGEQQDEVQHYQRRLDNLQIMVDANLRNSGWMRRFAIQHGYNPAGDMNEQEFIYSEFERMKKDAGNAPTGEQ